MSQVLWGEKIGLLPVDEHLYTVYFAQVPLARFLEALLFGQWRQTSAESHEEQMPAALAENAISPGRLA